jgi:hypothetical protein
MAAARPAMTDDERPETESATLASTRGGTRRTMVIAAAVAFVAVLVVGWLLFGPSTRETERALADLERPAPAPTPAPPPPPREEPPPPPAPEPVRRPRAAAPRPAPEPVAPAAPAAPSPTGILRVDSDVPGANVFVDRQYVGTTPFSASDLPPGQHRVNVSAEGFEGFAETVELSADKPVEITVRFKEVKLSETLAVVHKHGIGSCEGMLVADLQGLRYDTKDRDDRFLLAYGDVETFEVDYLKKNLRIKKRGGKTYNFTDKQPNADALLVFHRNVEKAKAKLAQ